MRIDKQLTKAQKKACMEWMLDWYKGHDSWSFGYICWLFAEWFYDIARIEEFIAPPQSPARALEEWTLFHERFPNLFPELVDAIKRVLKRQHQEWGGVLNYQNDLTGRANLIKRVYKQMFGGK